MIMTNYQVISQSNLGFFHLKNATPQNTNYNAAVFPKSRVFVSLPGLSGLNLSLNNSFGLSDAFTTTGDSTLFDVDRLLSNQKDNAFLNASMTLTDFMVGVRINENNFFTVFVNDRLDGTLFYPMEMLNFLWQGNAAYVGENFVADDFTYDLTYYREWGVGYGRSLNIMGFNTNIGVRLKYLNGLFHSSIEDNLGVNILTREQDYSLEIGFQEGVIRSAGINILDDGVDQSNYQYLIFNQNSGFGVDLAVNLDVNDKLSVGIGANDLGFISWKERTEITSLSGVSFTFEGLDLDNIDQFGQALQDSLDALEIDTVAGSFNTSLNSNTFLTGSYRVIDNGYVQASLVNYFTQGHVTTAFGIGYLQEVNHWLAASLTASAASQRGADLGAALMLRGGFFQFYTAVENIINTGNIPKAKGVSVRFGINFLFGKGPSGNKVEEVLGDDF